MFDTLYKEEILEHYKDPQNFGELKQFTSSSKQLNPFCGDEIEIFIEFKLNKVSDISFRGTGCAISIAAASMLTNFSKGKTKQSLTKFVKADMLNLLAVDISETRKKCALLALSVLKECLV